MKKVLKFKEGEKIPDNAIFLKLETVKTRIDSDWTWCGCPPILSCSCYTESEEQVFYYEVQE